MWLLNTGRSYLKQFPDSNGQTPPYVILSHVWGAPEDEVTFQDFIIPSRDRVITRKYQKPSCFCAFAAREGFEWAWLDTCCIDKSSSTELSEAINSMWTWYRRAKRCYVFLPDVRLDEDPGIRNSTFRRSKWFTRGWTLQEMLAPTEVVFVVNGPLDPYFTRVDLDYPKWVKIGTLETLAQIIEEVTQIDVGVLLRAIDLGDVSVAQKMSWAARRRTTRVEDRAYSLMGIFGVNLPAIYGEGEKAFMRLQLEILRQYPDQTIFAWGKQHSYNTLRKVLTTVESFGPGPEWAWDFRGLLASSPASFDASAHVRTLSNQSLSSLLDIPITISDFSPTQVGIRLHLPYYDFAHPRLGVLRLVILACNYIGDPVALLLHAKSDATNQYLVGVYHANTPPAPPWHPPFRVFRIPRVLLLDGGAELLLSDLNGKAGPCAPRLSTATRTPVPHMLIRWLPSFRITPESAPAMSFQMTDMYVHSHNPMVERSLQQRQRQGVEAERNPQPLPLLLIVLPGWVQLRLSAAGFEPIGDTVPEWLVEKPLSNSTRPGVAAKLPLQPGRCMHVLFHSANTRELFLFGAGVGESSEVWATVRFPKYEFPEHGATSWRGGRNDVLLRLARDWLGVRDTVGDRVQDWDRGMKRFYDAEVGLARCVEVRMVRSNLSDKRAMEYTLGLDARWEKRVVLELGVDVKADESLGNTKRSTTTVPAERYAASRRLDLAP